MSFYDAQNKKNYLGDVLLCFYPKKNVSLLHTSKPQKKTKKKFGIMKEDIIFALSESQMAKLNIWKDAIFTIYGEYGSFTYSFRPTPNSIVITVESDLIPNRILDLTETNN